MKYRSVSRHQLGDSAIEMSTGWQGDSLVSPVPWMNTCRLISAWVYVDLRELSDIYGYLL